MQQCGITHLTGFCDNMLVSVSKRNGLSKLAKANTGASRHAFLNVSKATCMSLISVTCLLFLSAPSLDRCWYSGCATWAIPWWITNNDLPSPERLEFQCRSEEGNIQPQLSDSPCWAECPPWIHDGLDNRSHCGRIHIYSAWVSGYALRSVWTQHTSVANTLLQSWKRQSHHQSRLGNMSSSICLGNSVLTSGRLLGHYTTQRACIHTQKILGSPMWSLYTVLTLCPWKSAKKPAFMSRQE